MTTELSITDRTQVRRKKERANYNREAVFAALDESPIGTIAFSDGTNVHAIPMAIWRDEEYLYIHGSNGSRLLKALQTGIQVCISVTNIHGFVLARAAPPHAINYSSVCIYGCFELVTENKEQHMKRFLEHWAPGRWQHVRPPNDKDLAATTIMRIAISEAVLKSRQGPPKDDVADMDQMVWAGIMPLSLQWQSPQQVAEQNDPSLPGQSLRVLR